MANGCDGRLMQALEHMQAAIELLDRSGAAPVGTAEYLDLAIHNLAANLEASGFVPAGRVRDMDAGERL